jgi:glutamate--cysteine ligase
VQIARGLAPLAGRWADAARDGLRDADFAAAAKDCFDAARGALGRLGAPRDITDILELYRERYVDRGRCPADDLLDSWRTTGRLTPMPEGATAPVA